MTTEREGKAMGDDGRRGAPGLTEEHDEWRHVREVLAKRTPDSELLVHRSGGQIVAAIDGRPVTVMLVKVPAGVSQRQADADLDALSVLWNVADELLASLARERRRLQSRIDWTFEALDAHQRGRQGTGEEIADDDIIDVAIALLMDGDDAEADVPVQGGEGEGR